MTKNKPHNKPAEERETNDQYFTPPDLAMAIVRNLEWFLNAKPKRILEPSVGGGAFVAACRELWPEAEITGCDIDPDVPGLSMVDVPVVGDFVDYPPHSGVNPRVYPFDLVIGNPPYFDNLHAKHADHAMNLLAPGGVLCFLLPQLFTGYTQNRSWFHLRHGLPKRMDVIWPRPKFTGKGTAMTEYSAMCWGDIEAGNVGIKWKEPRWELC